MVVPGNAADIAIIELSESTSIDAAKILSDSGTAPLPKAGDIIEIWGFGQKSPGTSENRDEH